MKNYVRDWVDPVSILFINLTVNPALAISLN